MENYEIQKPETDTPNIESENNSINPNPLIKLIQSKKTFSTISRLLKEEGKRLRGRWRQGRTLT